LQNMSGNHDSSDEDEWGAEELPLPTRNAGDQDGNDDKEKVDENYWEEQEQEQKILPSALVPPAAEESLEKEEEGEPMILVDMTMLSEGAIHSKFDRNSVNDSVAVSNLRRKIEGDYTAYAKDASLLSEGTVIPCGTTVWKMALIQLREERAGHYFTPIFPPKR
jgi:hypothetical protein